MKEADYQAKIINSIERKGGVVVNGNYSKAGIADLICGYPSVRYNVSTGEMYDSLSHLHIEVKTPEDYDRVFRSIKELKGKYVFNQDISSLKKHEYLQITKLNEVRTKGGLAIIAHSFQQVLDYVYENK